MSAQLLLARPESIVTDVPDEQTLLAILREQGVCVYRPDDVERYKLQKVRQATRPMRRQTVLKWSLGLGIIAGLLTTVLSFLAISQTGKNTLQLELITIGILFTQCCLVTGRSIRRLKIVARWDVMPPEAAEPLPPEVLALAAKITSAVPNLELRVHELWKHRRNEMRKLIDPFLSVHFGDASFCVAVWDEKGFRAPLYE